MKRILIGLIFLPLLCTAQERSNSELPKISNEIIGELRKATGWMYNPEGQWISRENRIPDYLPSQFSNVLDHEKYKSGFDNFQLLQWRTAEIKGKSYLILIKKYYKGGYKYPAIKQDWQDSYWIDYYVFNAGDSMEFKKIKDGTINLIKLNPVYHTQIFEVQPSANIADLVRDDIAASDFFKDNKIESPQKGKERFYALHLAPYKEKKIVQFLFYDYSKYKGKNERPSLYGIAGYDMDIAASAGTDELFKKCYYETDYETFTKFISFP